MSCVLLQETSPSTRIPSSVLGCASGTALSCCFEPRYEARLHSNHPEAAVERPATPDSVTFVVNKNDDCIRVAGRRQVMCIQHDLERVVV